MDYNRLFDKRFAGQPLLGTMFDEARNRTMKIFYIEESEHVGIYDSVDTWISPVKGCFKSLKEGFLLEQIALAEQGKISPESPQRHRLLTAPVKKVFQHRGMTHAN